MAKLPICPYCSQSVDKGQPSKVYQKRTYHQHCYKKMCDEKYAKTDKKTTAFAQNDKKVVTQQDLYSYICKLFKLNELNGKLISQLKNLFSDYNYTYGGVMLTLKYFFEIKGNEPDLKYGIGIVPFVYDEAKEFFSQKKIIKQKMENTEFKKEEKTVLYKKKPRQNKRLVDIDKL